MRKSVNQYRSYSEKKSRSKRIHTYLFRALILILFYSLFTSFLAISVGVSQKSMSPSLDAGDSVIVVPTNSLTSVFSRDNNLYSRGEIILSGTNYQVDSTRLEELLDPVVRIFTLQKKSLLYSNSNNMGRAEFYRIIGLPGDVIKISDYTVYIKPKGEEFFLSEFELTESNFDILKRDLPENWKPEYPFSSEFEETTIKDGHYFLVSDNRYILNDSRIFGSVPSSKIKGKVLLRYWPLNKIEIF